MLVLPYEKVVRLYVTVDDSLLVTLFNATNHLYSAVAHSLHVKLLLAVLEQRLERLAQQVHHHHMELVARCHLVCADVVQLRHESFNSH